MIKEIEIFARNIIDEGGEFYTLETCKRGKLVKTVTHYEVKYHTYNEGRYQVFNSEGKRIFVSTDLMTAKKVYQKLIDGEDGENEEIRETV